MKILILKQTTTLIFETKLSVDNIIELALRHFNVKLSAHKQTFLFLGNEGHIMQFQRHTKM